MTAWKLVPVLSRFSGNVKGHIEMGQAIGVELVRQFELTNTQMPTLDISDIYEAGIAAAPEPDDAVIERMALAICKERGWSEGEIRSSLMSSEWDDWLSCAQAALTAMSEDSDAG